MCVYTFVMICFYGINAKISIILAVSISMLVLVLLFFFCWIMWICMNDVSLFIYFSLHPVCRPSCGINEGELISCPQWKNLAAFGEAARADQSKRLFTEDHADIPDSCASAQCSNAKMVTWTSGPSRSSLSLCCCCCLYHILFSGYLHILKPTDGGNCFENCTWSTEVYSNVQLCI